MRKKMSSALIALFMCMTLSYASAQHIDSTNSSGVDNRHRCYVHIPEEEASSSFRSFAAYPTTEKIHNPLPQSEYLYVFRLAVGITADAYKVYFQNKENKVQEFWTNLERELNEFYVKSCGIRFEVVRNKSLIKNALFPVITELYKATGILNQILGENGYDAGIMIQPSGEFSGLAVLGGIRSQSTKGAAYADRHTSTIAHELGHLFGARHSHVGYRLDGVNVEPDSGQSIMSYGMPRTFFALASVQAIKNTLAGLSYYTEKERKNRVDVSNESQPNLPYVVPIHEPKPKLDEDAIRQEYVVTRGTHYQFYIPTVGASQGLLYHAHPFDQVRGKSMPTNTMQRSYDPSTSNVVMYHPRYTYPFYGMKNISEAVLPFSNVYESGLYTYVLSAFNKEGYHASQRVKLRIVDGEVFKITEMTGLDGSSTAIAGVSELGLKWQPCHQLYGKDSKVRILLSTDFGQSFPYVLADNVPNTGSWSGTCPYIQVGTHEMQFIKGRVRSGVLKVEVVGQAAFSLSHLEPYTVSGSSFVATGGFTISTDPSQTITFANAPAAYSHYQRRVDVPAMTALTAQYAGQTVQVEGKQVETGNSLTRTWAATIQGKTAVYTQVITLSEGQGNKQRELMAKVLELRRNTHDMRRNLGSLGYPKADVPSAVAFVKAYDAVFTDDAEPRDELTEEYYTALKNALRALQDLGDEDIVMPISGVKYKIANYKVTFGRERNYYINSSGSAREGVTSLADNATIWECVAEGNGAYRFVAPSGDVLSLHGTSKGEQGFSLLRGYTWGAYSFVGGLSSNECRIAWIGQDQTIGYNGVSRADLNSYKANKDDLIISTDFRLIPVSTSYSITLVQSEGGTIELAPANPIHVAAGTQVAVLVKPNDGYQIESLTLDSEDITKAMKFVVKGNHTLAVRWKKAAQTDRVEQPTLKVYPNPTARVICVEGARRYADYQLFDLSGRIFARGIITQHKQQIDLSGCPAGVYILCVDGVYTRVARAAER
ncbi:MAG: zinc-dependent metalloprotease [Porphyromonadaceae bacterium]|nr:zinc-dependent metalloprotease [Porphyromonadaceae bacterium]